MKSRAMFAAILALSVGLLACGKYGPPMRRPPLPPPPPPAAAQPEPPAIEEEAVEEEVLGPSDFEEAESDQENGP